MKPDGIPRWDQEAGRVDLEKTVKALNQPPHSPQSHRKVTLSGIELNDRRIMVPG